MIRLLIILFSILPLTTLFAQKYEAELVNTVTHISIKNGKLVKTVTVEIKINNRAGEKYTRVSIPFSSMEKVSGIEGYIKDNQGEIVRKLKKNDITERSFISDFSFYEDHFIKEFTLKHNNYPYTVVYSYQVQEDEFIYVDYWLPVIDIKVPTLQASLTVEVPNDYKMAIREQFVGHYKTSSYESKIKYTWNASFNEVIEPETFSPPMLNYLPSVVIVPQEFNYETDGSFSTWKSYGDWQYQLLEDIEELPESEKTKIYTLIRGMDHPVDKIKTLYHYLQDETRYINISIETGGLKPHSAAYVAKNKYGDCKALTNYFKSVLNTIGIPSYYTKVWAGDPIRSIDKSMPSQQSNHVILYVPIESDTLWLDCTSDGPFNYLGTFSQNREVFIIEKNNSHLAWTPAFSPNEVLETRRIKFFPDNINGLKAQFENTYKGGQYESLFSASHAMSESRKLSFIRDHFVEKGFELLDFNLKEAPRDSAVIHLSYSAGSDNIYKDYGNETLIKILPFSIPEFEKPGTRKLPVQLDYPISKTDTLEYSIPIGNKVSNTLQPQHIESKYGDYAIEFQEYDNKIVVIKSFLLHSGEYGIEEYDDFYNFITEVIKLEKSTYLVTTQQR